MLTRSDFHIHSEYSYDASNPLEMLAEEARAQGLCRIGITDHANFNDESFLSDIRRSAETVKEAQKTHPFMILGVELTPVAKAELDYIAKTGTREGYEPPTQGLPYELGMALTKEEMLALGIQYGLGASHWRADQPYGKTLPPDLEPTVREFYRQQMWLACDDRVTILGHPWYIGNNVWYEDFSVIPHSMHEDIGAALKENGKYAECNAHFFRAKSATEKFRHQYAEFLREWFEMGIPITFGSDAHKHYPDWRPVVEPYLRAAGFCDGDFSEIAEKDLWQ